jgi:hypothetical protein
MPLEELLGGGAGGADDFKTLCGLARAQSDNATEPYSDRRAAAAGRVHQRDQKARLQAEKNAQKTASMQAPPRPPAPSGNPARPT